MSTIPRTDPPYVADELTTLRSFIDHYRATLRRQCEHLTQEQLRTPLPPSTMTLGGLLTHLAWVEQFWFGEVLLGEDAPGFWADAPWSDDVDWDWHVADRLTAGEIDHLFVTTTGRSDRQVESALAAGTGLDTIAVRERHGERVSLRWILVHLVEEYSRHAGHADLIRESLDGATGL